MGGPCWLKKSSAQGAEEKTLGPECTGNFQIKPFVFDGETFYSCEHAYQAHKFHAGSESRALLLAVVPLEGESAHGHGMRCWEAGGESTREDWDAVKVQIMLDVNRAKYAQHEDCRAELLATGDLIIEGGPSTSWQHNGKLQKWDHWNGIIQMLIREELRGAERDRRQEQLRAQLQGLVDEYALLPTQAQAGAEVASSSHQVARAEEIAVIAGKAPKGFRFAVTKAADEQAPPGVAEQIFGAAWEGKLDELLGLCQEWADHPVIDAYKNGGGWNALINAAYKGHEACVRVLIASNADVAHADKYCCTALHCAAKYGHASICRALVDEGASLTAVSDDGKTPLEEAKAGGNVECVAVLEAATAAAAAAKVAKSSVRREANGRASFYHTLIDKGASLTTVNSNDQKPRELAKVYENVEAVTRATRLANLLTSRSPLSLLDLEAELKQHLSSEPTFSLLLGSLRSALCFVAQVQDKESQKDALEISQEAIDSLLDNLRTTDPSLTLLDDLKDVRELVLNRAYADALSKGSRSWRRSRLMILGEGRAGKSSLLRALTGKPFVADLASTAGVSVSDYISVGEAGAVIGEYMQWQECDKDRLEVERTLLEQVVSEARKPKKLQAKTKKPTSRIMAIQQQQDQEKQPQQQLQQLEKKAQQFQAPAEAKAPELAVLEPFENAPIVARAEKLPALASEKDEVKHKGDIQFSTDLVTSDEPKITFTIFDYGGQRCFQCLQHVLLSRTGIYVVCFDMVKMSSPDEAVKTNALGFVRFWLRQVALQASGAPVLLVGTHKDVVPDEATHATISAYLDANLSPLHESTHALRTGGSLKQNDSLCFFPIDNQQAHEPDCTLDKLKKRIEKEVEADPSDYVNQEMPTSWLAFCDELRVLSRDGGIKYLKRQGAAIGGAGGGGRGVQRSIMGIARKHNIFQGPLSEDEQLSSLLTTLHSLGVIIFYDDPLLRDTIILDPQWLIDSLVAIIRDFKLHRFEADGAIMDNELTKWTKLTEFGLLSSSLLPYLWLGNDDETKRFLVSMMERLMLLTPIGAASASYDANIETQFFVPSIMTSLDVPVALEQYNAALQFSSSCMSFRFEMFLPEALFSRLVTILARAHFTPTLQSTASKFLPIFLDDQLAPPCTFYDKYGQVSACLALSGLTLIVRPSAVDPLAIDVLVLSSVPLDFDLRPLLEQIRAAVETINKDFYQSSLRVDFAAFSDIKDISSHIVQPSQLPPSPHQALLALQQQEEAARNLVQRADGVEILSYFMMQKCMVDEVDAKRYAGTLVECGYKGASCFDLLKNKAHDDAFDVDALIALAKIDSRAFADQIFRELKREPDVKDPLVLALYDKSFGSETEVDKIPRAVGYKGKCKKMAVCSSSLFTCLGRELSATDYTVLHLASRTPSTTGVPLFLVRADEDPSTIDAPNVDELVEEITSFASLECIVLNYATSAAIDHGLAARLEAKGLSKPLFIIGWQGKVDSNAMNAFTEVFYAELRGQKDGARDYSKAFDKAKMSLLRCNMNCNFESDDNRALVSLRTGPPLKPLMVTVGVIRAISYAPSTAAAATTRRSFKGSSSGSNSTASSGVDAGAGAAVAMGGGGGLAAVVVVNQGPVAFLSHEWGKRDDGYLTHQKIKRIFDKLTAIGVNCWFDESKGGLHAADDLGHALCKGIDDCDVFVSFINTEYIRKTSSPDPQDNCRKEFDYASLRKKCLAHGSRMLACVIDPSCFDQKKWNGVVGMELGRSLYTAVTNFDDEAAFHKSVIELAEAIRDLQSRYEASVLAAEAAAAAAAAASTAATVAATPPTSPTAAVPVDASAAAVGGGGGGGGGGGASADALEAAWQIISNVDLHIKEESKDAFSKLVKDLIGNRALTKGDLKKMVAEDVAEFAQMMPRLSKRDFERAMQLVLSGL